MTNEKRERKESNFERLGRNRFTVDCKFHGSTVVNDMFYVRRLIDVIVPRDEEFVPEIDQ